MGELKKTERDRLELFQRQFVEQFVEIQLVVRDVLPRCTVARTTPQRGPRVKVLLAARDILYSVVLESKQGIRWSLLRIKSLPLHRYHFASSSSVYRDRSNTGCHSPAMVLLLALCTLSHRSWISWSIVAGAAVSRATVPILRPRRSCTFGCGNL